MVLSPVRSPRPWSRSLEQEQERGPSPVAKEKARPKMPKSRTVPKGQGKGGRKGKTVDVSSDEDGTWGKWQGAEPPSSAGRPKPPATGASGSPPAPEFIPCWKYGVGDECLFWHTTSGQWKSSVVKKRMFRSKPRHRIVLIYELDGIDRLFQENELRSLPEVIANGEPPASPSY